MVLQQTGSKASNFLKVRRDVRQMIDTKTEEIYFTDFYVIGNPRQALRRQVALAAVYRKKEGDMWWIGREEFTPIQQMKDKEEILAFLQPFVDQDAEHMAELVAKAGAKA